MKLQQLSGQTSQVADYNHGLRTIALGEMYKATQLFNYAEFYSMLGNADAPKMNSTDVGGSQRAINSDYVGTTGAPVTTAISLEILGDLIKTDLAYERRGGNIESERERELKSFASGLGRYFVNQFINGSGGGNQITGLVNQIVAAETIELGSGNGLDVALGNSDAVKKAQQAFIEGLEELIAQVGAGAVLLMSPKTISRLSAIARERILVSSVDNVFGLVTSYNGTPIVNAGYSKDKTTLVLPNTEVVGASQDCCSVYCVRFGERADVSIATNVGLQVRDRGLVGVQYNTLVEMDAQVALLNAKSAFRMTGVRFA